MLSSINTSSSLMYARELPLLSVCRDYGEEVSIELGSNSSAAKGVLGRLGLGKVRRLETGLLWI